jgi:hypothetical protein
MYRESLPNNCPHVSAQEDEKYLYRIFKNNINHDSEFQCYALLFPEIEKYQTMCAAYAISFFGDRESALKKMKERPELGTHLAQVLVKKEHGKLHCTSKKTGHYNLWVYKSFDCSRLEVQIESPDYAS